VLSHYVLQLLDSKRTESVAKRLLPVRVKRKGVDYAWLASPWPVPTRDLSIVGESGTEPLRERGVGSSFGEDRLKQPLQVLEVVHAATRCRISVASCWYASYWP